MQYYQTGEHLHAKHAQIHNQSGRKFEEWALQLVSPTPTTRMLDVGCGWGRFSWPLIQRHGVRPANLVCADYSLGMVQSAVAEGSKRGHRPHFVNCGIESLPFADGAFEGVLANHVLYHVEPLAQGVRELARVLRPDGWLMTTTNGAVYVPVIDLHYKALDRLAIPYEPEPPGPFTLENGAAILAQSFAQVERYDFVDEVIHGNAAAFTQNYLTIGRYRNVIARNDISAAAKAALPNVFHELAHDMILRDGAIRAPVLMGAFICQGPKT